MRFLVALLFVVCLSLCVSLSEAGFLKARYRHNMMIGADGEDERVYHRKLHYRNKDVTHDPNPPMFEKVKISRSYHYKFGPQYPTHHSHLRNQYFPLPKNQLLHP